MSDLKVCQPQFAKGKTREGDKHRGWLQQELSFSLLFIPVLQVFVYTPPVFSHMYMCAHKMSGIQHIKPPLGGGVWSDCSSLPSFEYITAPFSNSEDGSGCRRPISLH